MKKVAYFLLGLLIILQSCQNSDSEMTGKKTVQEEAPIDYLALGKDYAIETKSVLGKNLTQALGEGGTEHALSFCNTRAIPLTDSVNVALNTTVKRVSDRPRNINNQANSDELAFIDELKSRLEKGEVLKPMLREMDHKMIAYYPILTNGMCLQCHGKKGTDIALETQFKLKELYPSDAATGYTDGQVRGLFVVEMNKN